MGSMLMVDEPVPKYELTQKLMVEGPIPRPEIISLRNWDYRILDRYDTITIYTPTSDTCDYCTFGKCDLTGNKEVACGIDLEAQSAREALLTCVMGAACHTGHSHHLLDYFIKKYGKDYPIDVGPTDIEAPMTETIIGFKTGTIGDFIPVLEKQYELNGIQAKGIGHIKLRHPSGHPRSKNTNS